MHVKHLACIKCENVYAKDKIRYRCACGESLEVVYDYGSIKKKLTWKGLRTRPFRHWRYREFFPLVRNSDGVSLMEGGTPLLRSKNISEELGFKNLYLKCEGENPTGSFKDRGTTVEISRALEFGASEIVCASTGNMGASVAAYAALAGVKANIILPYDTPDAKIAQVRSYGASIHKVRGDYNMAEKKAFKLFDKKGWYLMGDYPYRGEGEKSVAFEICDEISPDYIFTPLGNGTLVQGMWKGIKELEKTALLKKLPKLVGIQASGCNTVSKAFKNKSNAITQVEPKTIAGAIACGKPLDGLKALNAIRESEGICETVTDREILNARSRLAKREGIYAEPAGAAPLAGLMKLKRVINNDAVIVLVVSGSGLKTM